MGIKIPTREIEIEIQGVKFFMAMMRGNELDSLEKRFGIITRSKILRFEGEIEDEGRLLTLEDIKESNFSLDFMEVVMSELCTQYANKISEVMGFKRSEQKNETPSA